MPIAEPPSSSNIYNGKECLFSVEEDGGLVMERGEQNIDSKGREIALSQP